MPSATPTTDAARSSIEASYRAISLRHSAAFAAKVQISVQNSAFWLEQRGDLKEQEGGVALADYRGRLVTEPQHSSVPHQCVDDLPVLCMSIRDKLNL